MLSQPASLCNNDSFSRLIYNNAHRDEQHQLPHHNASAKTMLSTMRLSPTNPTRPPKIEPWCHKPLSSYEEQKECKRRTRSRLRWNCDT